MIVKKFLALALLSVFVIGGCSSSLDTSKYSAEEHYNYAMTLYNDEDYEPALQEFQTVLLQFPGSTVSDDAQYYLGMTYVKREQYLLAAYEFSKLIKNMPASPYVSDAQFMLADSYYQLSPPYPLDQTYTKKAIEELQAFIDFFPTSPKVEEAERKIQDLNERIARKEYESAVIYEKMEYEKAALQYFTYVAETYHDTKYAPLALYRKIKIMINRGMKNEVMTDIATFLSRYPNDANAPEIRELETGMGGSK